MCAQQFEGPRWGHLQEMCENLIVLCYVCPIWIFSCLWMLGVDEEVDDKHVAVFMHNYVPLSTHHFRKNSEIQ